MTVDGHTNQPARHGAGVVLPGRHICRVWPTVAHGHTKALRAADGDIGTHRTRFFQQCQRQRVRGDDADGIGRVQLCDYGSEVAQVAIRPRILENRRKHVVGVQIIRIADCHLDPQRGRAGFHHGNVLWVTVFVDEKAFDLRLCHALRHCHRLGAGCCLIQQRCVCDFQPCQVRHHSLEIQKRL